MSGFGILMLIFAFSLLLVGIYMSKGHELKMIKWKAAFKGITIDGWKKVGKYTIIVSIFIFILGINGLIFNFE